MSDLFRDLYYTSWNNGILDVQGLNRQNGSASSMMEFLNTKRTPYRTDAFFMCTAWNKNYANEVTQRNERIDKLLDELEKHGVVLTGEPQGNPVHSRITLIRPIVFIPDEQKDEKYTAESIKAKKLKPYPTPTHCCGVLTYALQDEDTINKILIGPFDQPGLTAPRVHYGVNTQYYLQNVGKAFYVVLSDTKKLMVHASKFCDKTGAATMVYAQNPTTKKWIGLVRPDPALTVQYIKDTGRWDELNEQRMAQKGLW